MLLKLSRPVWGQPIRKPPKTDFPVMWLIYLPGSEQGICQGFDLRGWKCRAFTGAVRGAKIKIPVIPRPDRDCVYNWHANYTNKLVHCIAAASSYVTGEEKVHGPTGIRTQYLSHTVRALWPRSYWATRSTCDNFPLLNYTLENRWVVSQLTVVKSLKIWEGGKILRIFNVNQNCAEH